VASVNFYSATYDGGWPMPRSLQRGVLRRRRWYIHPPPREEVLHHSWNRVSVVVSDSRGCVVISTDVGDVRFTVSGKHAHDMRSKLDPWLGPAPPERDAAKQEQEAQRGPVVAKFAPGVFGAIRVYQDGTIESRFGSGSVIGAPRASINQAVSGYFETPVRCS